jgi:chemotaxis protein CheD
MSASDPRASDPRASDPRAVGPSRVAELKAQPRRPGEAGFFYYDAHFRNDAVKVMPGEYFVDGAGILLMTTLGSCIATCLWDRRAQVGGMNHFMLPDGDGASGRYGSYAMELLINELMKRGASRATLEAKVFGGGQVMRCVSGVKIGERNTRFVLDYLATERIPVISKDVLDVYPRKVCFLPHTGKALMQRLQPVNPELAEQEARAALAKVTPVAGAGGSVDLF